MLKLIWKKYKLWILFLLSAVSFILFYRSVFSTDYSEDLLQFREQFKKQEYLLHQFLDEKRTEIARNEANFVGLQDPEKDAFFLHVFQKDTLSYWNTNQLPILKFADIHFPTNGIMHAQNGWYYVMSVQENQKTLCGSFLIKHDYPYQNENLINSFEPPFRLDHVSYLSLDQENGFPIYSKDKQYLFSIIVSDYQPANYGESVLLLVLLLASLSFLLFAVSETLLQRKMRWWWMFPLTLLFIRYLSIELVWFGFMHDSEGFQASLYGTSGLFPNFFEYLLNVVILLVVIRFVSVRIELMGGFRYGKPTAILLFLISYPAWFFLLYLYRGLIENSSIPLEIEALFSLNWYSVLAIISIGVLGYSLFLYIRMTARFAKNQGINDATLPVVCFVVGVLYFIWEINAGYLLLFAGIFPILFFGLILYLEYKEARQKHLVMGILLLAVFSLTSAVNLSEFNRRKDRSERELYANKLVSEQDIVTEVEYANLASSIREDKFLQKLLASDMQLDPRDFDEGMERRHFNGFWERYEVGFQLFDSRNRSILKLQGDQDDLYADLNALIHDHGQRSEIDSSVFFISDYTGQYSYIIRQNLMGKDSVSGTLFCTLKSKKIPEEIGFPRLLISSKAVAFEHLESYSVAKYHRNRLVSKYGRFNYPTSVSALKRANPNRYNNFDYQGHNHFMLYKSGSDVIVLSGKNVTWVDNLTSFSYLFSFYGLLLLPIFFRFYSNSFFRHSLTLAAKIQLVLIGLVFVSLLGFGWGSGVFVSNQYNEYTNDVIREKLLSIETELKSKLGKTQKLTIQENGTYANFLLMNLSKVFITDINFYDPQGYLLATSRPKVFNIGLLSEQMNPVARRQLSLLDKSEFIHQERIGDLGYSSAYLPFYNNQGRLLGFINLQHFGQQEEFEHQIQRFLVAIINVFMLLLAISIVFAIFVSNWVTAPLRLLQESFSKVRFGTYNQQISYEKDDEIGALVKDYNQKLEELELTAQQLAQSERESAWRDMAKQVAHEIKNPLTPMKLSVQHLIRSFDPADPKSLEKLTKVSESLIEQIDALTHIANEFSSFAKMPRPNVQEVDLIQIIRNSVEVFRQGTDASIQLSGVRACLLIADKEQLLRVFNNLLKNSLQAIPDSRKGVVEIHVSKSDKRIIITVNDNGEGIPEDKRAQIFTPYFTTKSTGTGIGLAMVKQIVLNHGGTIRFESVVDEGTTFTIELPKIAH